MVRPAAWRGWFFSEHGFPEQMNITAAAAGRRGRTQPAGTRGWTKTWMRTLVGGAASLDGWILKNIYFSIDKT